MSSPVFSWWPYGVIAIIVPFLALGSTVAAAFVTHHTDDGQLRDILIVYFSILGAGNAFLFATAIGDLGRTVLAIPVGTLSGFVAVKIFSHPLATGVCIALLLIFVVQAMISGAMTFLLGFGCLFLLLIGGCFTYAFREAVEPGLSLVCTFPFLCGVAAGMMAYENTAAACRNGMLNALYSLVYAALFGVLFVLALGLLGTLYPGINSVMAGWALSVGGTIMLSISNYFCAEDLFPSLHRVR